MSESETTPKNAPSVYEHVAYILEQMASVAWQKMGLQPDPFTGRVDPNLPEAKVAVDLVAHLAKTLEPELDESDRRRINSLVRDLRINYVEKSEA
jgi:hypothetical protein